jgi:hypothetical protein
VVVAEGAFEFDLVDERLLGDAEERKRLRGGDSGGERVDDHQVVEPVGGLGVDVDRHLIGLHRSLDREDARRQRRHRGVHSQEVPVLEPLEPQPAATFAPRRPFTRTTMLPHDQALLV